MAKNPDHYAIVIGIDRYPQLPILEGPVSDATAFKDWLVSPDGGGLPEQNARLILTGAQTNDPLDAQPVKVEIDRALRDFGLERNKKIGKRLYFYFSGHGFGAKFDDVGMLMANASATRLGSNIGLRPFREFFNDFIFFDEIVYVLDCCRDNTQKSQTQGPDFTPIKKALKGHAQEFVVLAAAY